ncbi:MAG: 50S ribosomal protein L36 [Alphaproteobacteria bacterium]|nr:50S ribosomal protein L36 [Alphaproteobacteria bacterium]
MKFLSSLKGWKNRSSKIKQVRRGKQVILIDPDNPKLKAKQGFKKK